VADVPGLTLSDGQATLVVDVAAVLPLTAAAAQALAAVVGVGRAPVGRPDSPVRRELAADLAATLQRRLARSAGVANRLRVALEVGPGEGEATLRWPVAAGGEDDARALAGGVARLAAGLADQPDEGTLRRALAAEGVAVADRTGGPAGPSMDG